LLVGCVRFTDMTSKFTYIGNELDVFYLARNWKAYWADKVLPYLGAEVLEVGAGTGSNTELLCSGRQNRWLCLEPDGILVRALQTRVENHPHRAAIQVQCGMIGALAVTERFDTVLYMDVLEHIEGDRSELAAAGKLLRPGGHCIVLAPAHQWLYSPFDRSIGHFRRYSKASLAAAAPRCLELQRIVYLDSAGLLASAANKVCLRQSVPTAKQITFWDRWLVPVSVHIDKGLGFRLGKTVLGIWTKERD
jgi:SAM-dependent methyltransferase